jgi:hypothetical protein
MIRPVKPDLDKEPEKMSHKGVNTATTLWTMAPQSLALRSETLSSLADGYLRCRALFSAVSRGTESLIFAGKVPESEWQSMRAPCQRGDFPFPVAYGYQMVAEVREGPLPAGTRIFALHPHQDVFDVPLSAARVLPGALPARRAVLAANMETALNAVWDSGAGPGDKIAIIGAGVVGLLIAHLLGQMPGIDLTVLDPDVTRRSCVESTGGLFVSQDSDLTQGHDVVIHTSASAAGLAAAINAAGNEARIVELSWYGAGVMPVALGGAFHSRRLQLISSQVGQISPSRRARWDYARRLDKALELLCDDRFDALLEADIPFMHTPLLLPAILAKSGALAQVISY